MEGLDVGLNKGVSEGRSDSFGDKDDGNVTTSEVTGRVSKTENATTAAIILTVRSNPTIAILLSE